MKSDSKCKQCRRAGEKLFLKGERCFSPKCAMVRRPYAPGVHGRKRRPALSEYGMQLAEKQKMKRSYLLRENQFRKYFDMASKKKGVVGDNFLQILESRLDNAVFRAGIAGSRSIARQMVGHGHITLNGRRVDVPSILLKPGDKIAIREGSKNKGIFADLKHKIKKHKAPDWILLDKENMSFEIKRLPEREDLDRVFDVRLITELYSK